MNEIELQQKVQS